jgi:phosphotransferase system enzyme I (PtsI)
MLKLRGVGAAPGAATGPAHLFGWRIDVHERRIPREEAAEELARFARALDQSDAQLARIQLQIAAEEGDEHQDYQILEAHRLMLKDAHLVDEARRLIREELYGAEWAVRCSLDRIRSVFDRIEDPYFRERRSDIDAITERLLRNLIETADTTRQAIPPGSAVYGHDLSPADITQLGRAGVAVGFFTEAGGKTSHSAVVARALGLPLVVGVPDIAANVRAGSIVIVDGSRGEVILDPDAEALEVYEARAAKDRAMEQNLTALRSQPAQTRDGSRIHLAANVELLEEIPIAVDLGAESIGLFRTEYLYLDRSTLPSEEEQFDHLVSALERLGDRVATLRTLDLGGDKLPPSVRIPAGANPALGLRSIRFSLWQPEVFRAQLRAFYRAAAVGKVRILFPMISGVAEMRQVREICETVLQDLERDGVRHNPDVPLGAMVETPSAALISDLLADECDFLTIGTNDLIQYALAADRQDEHVGYLYHPLHPGILRAIRMIVDGARQAKKPIAMCGDMAGDPLFSWVLLGMGLRDFSMAPRQIPRLKAIIRATGLADAQSLLAEVASLKTVDEVEDLVGGVMHRHFPELVEGNAAARDA